MGVVYIFDLTNEESLNALKMWRERVEAERNGKITELLIGTKKDLKHLREVTKESAESFCR